MLFFPTLLLASALAVEARVPHRSKPLQARDINVRSPTPFKRASAIKTTSHVLSLKSKKTESSYNPRSAAFVLGHAKIPVGNSTGLVSLFEGEEFATDVTFGAQTLEFIVDTGSSDTWVIESGFDCVDVQTGEAETEDYCAFGPTYTRDDGFLQIPNENFNITYGDGEFLTGILGWEDVTLAGITVNQTVPLVNFAAWYGDGETSGLLGLAYPGITSAFEGNDPHEDNIQIPYDPIFTTMYKNGLIDPLFSLVIERNVSGRAGYLSLGGVPPIDFEQNFTSTPILITSIPGYPQAYDFYTINIDTVLLDDVPLASSGGDIQYIVDSGTTLNYFPTEIADAINAAFVPATNYSAADGVYIVDCTAAAPSLSVQINGTAFHTNLQDMILLAGTDSQGNNICITGVNDGGATAGGNVFILGDTFLKNVVAVFDVGAVQLSFASREFYPNNDPVTKI